MARTNGGTPRARALGAELRQAREERGVGVRELARRLGTDHSKISRYESGVSATPSPEYVASVLTALGVSESERERLASVARGANEATWVSTGVPGAQHELTTLIEFERDASQVVEVSTMVLPGLLQTSDYARAVMTGASNNDVEARVALRLGRREVLTRGNGPHFTALILETALRTPIGGRGVLAEQLRQIADMAAWPNVTVQVIPSDIETWHPAHVGAFILFEFPKSKPIVHIEQYSSAVFLHEPEDGQAYQEAVGRLRQLAMSPAESTEIITRTAKEMENSR
ncbi:MULTISPECIES: helix-turn-helix transcriptional regulator [unclassified Actinopolyspora]|uniref:helix-turn-helix domain-containing protein n=1 Tax=unclassified Actinopolyspora TaxID=2639451 RepID=UPI0013F66C6B|nr:MULTISPECIES: helix-turn-helix transcriptional regulator [unclassified Actinopolyspora]NHD18119.1 helix-turn-helix domain-containing protein [Actinopolyspora sp. BKK2]NHE77204.1 helix-turn-helix domain-containing protein [Actinopolyspora sp. BKK1]